MKYIYDFVQEKLLSLSTSELKINASDALILHYIVTAVCSTKMQRVYRDNKMYVWIDMQHLLDSLPILAISKNRLCVVMKKYKDLGIIESCNIANHKVKGTKSYICITDKLVSCMTTKMAETYREKFEQFVKTKTESKPVCENTNSDNNQQTNNNTLLNNKLLSKDISKSFSFGYTPKTTKSSKKFTYQDCIGAINDFTDDVKLRDCLVDYLNLRLSMMKEKPMRLVQWLSLLKTLADCIEKSDKSAIDIVRYSINKGYTTFYPLTNNYKSTGVSSESGVRHVPRMTEEDYEAERKQMAELEAQGMQVIF